MLGEKIKKEFQKFFHTPLYPYRVYGWWLFLKILHQFHIFDQTDVSINSTNEKRRRQSMIDTVEK